jgi:hypothetical protein
MLFITSSISGHELMARSINSIHCYTTLFIGEYDNNIRFSRCFSDKSMNELCDFEGYIRMIW